MADKSESLGAAPRQRRSIAEKRRIVEETLVEDASVARVARLHGINANQVFGWRRLYQAGRLGERKPAMKLLPVRVSESVPVPLAKRFRVDVEKVEKSVAAEFAAKRSKRPKAKTKPKPKYVA
jgi:transposase